VIQKIDTVSAFVVRTTPPATMAVVRQVAEATMAVVRKAVAVACVTLTDVGEVVTA